MEDTTEVENFISTQREELEYGIRHNEQLLCALQSTSKQTGAPSEAEYKEIRDRVEAKMLPYQKKLATINRHATFLTRDLEAEMLAASERDFYAGRPRHPPHSEVLAKRERIFEFLLARKMIEGTKSQMKQYRFFERTKFDAVVLKYYGSVKEGKDEEEKQAICSLTGDTHSLKDMKAVQIVPESLLSHDLAHLFGIDELYLSDARNGM